MTHQMDLNPGLTNPMETGGDFIARSKRAGWIVLILCSVIQVLFFASLMNLLAVSAVIFGWLVLARIFLQPSMIATYPLSSFLMIAFVSTQLYFPLALTTVEGKPLIFNIELPEQVFLHSTLALIVLAIAHALYRLLSRLSTKKTSSLLAKTGFFTPPSDAQLWTMGFIGIISTYYIYFLSPEVGWGVTAGSATDKLIQGLTPFSYAPFFIPFSVLYGNKKSHSKRLIVWLLLFTVILFLVSIGRNSRGAFMFGFTSLGFAYILGLLLGVFKIRLFTWRNAIIAGVFVWLIIGPIADLGTAMVIVRHERDGISSAELIDLTLQAFSDKEAIAARRLEDSGIAPEPDWDERYLDNIILARFSNLKFNDMSLVQFSKLSQYDPDMLEYSLDYLLCQLPEPVLEKLEIDVDKEAILTLSFGDFIYLAAGGYGPANGYRTGHFAGTGMATFGWWYLLLLGVTVIPVFWLFDKFYRKRTWQSSSGDGSYTTYQFSFCGILALTTIFYFLTAESVVNIVVFLFRGYIQMVVLYFLIFHATRILTATKSVATSQKSEDMQGMAV
jgi:hypothetical protein